MNTRIIGFLFLIYSVSLQGQLIQDQSYVDESFVLFRAELQMCISQKDQVCLKSLLADKIKLGKDSCPGEFCSKDDFINFFFDYGNNEAFWGKLQKVVRFGFSYKNEPLMGVGVDVEDEFFRAPSFRNSFDEDNEALLLGSNINIRRSRSVSAPVIQRSSFEVFKCDCNPDTFKASTLKLVDGIEWLEIYVNDSEKGYVAAKYTSFLNDTNLIVAKVNGQWRIVEYSWPIGC